MLRITDQYFWNFIFLLFFLCFVVMGIIILNTEARINPEDLTLVDLTLITLASVRIIRLMVYDDITKFFREQFLDIKETKVGFVLVKPESGPRRTLADLLSCPWCVGLWAGAIVVFIYLWTPYAYFPILFLAISSVATTLQLLANMIGWRAEVLKQESERL
jgi:MFS family permease